MQRSTENRSRRLHEVPVRSLNVESVADFKQPLLSPLRALGTLLSAKRPASGFLHSSFAGDMHHCTHRSGRHGPMRQRRGTCNFLSASACAHRWPGQLSMCAVVQQPRQDGTMLDRLRENLPLWVDGALASAGAGLTIYLLSILQTGKFVLYAPPMGAVAAAYFYYGRPPTQPKVCLAILGATSSAVAISQFQFGPTIGHSLAVASAVLFFRVSGSIFPPAAALSGLFADNAVMAKQGWMYPLFPCLAGNLVIYACAWLWAQVRAYVEGKATSFAMTGKSCMGRC